MRKRRNLILKMMSTAMISTAMMIVERRKIENWQRVRARDRV
jgi:hypothetical protein